ncbi:MAG TPA: AraC family transcriptional regulator, partial [bacterium]
GVAAAYFKHMSPVRVSQECAYYLVWPKITNLLRYWHEESGDLALHCGGALVPGDPLVDVLVHVNLTEHITAYRALFGEATVIDHLAVRGISAADAERMSKVLGCRVVGGQPRTWLAMPKEILDRPLNYADPWLREQIRPQVEDFLRMLDDGRDATMAVRMAMDSELAAGRPVDLAALATVMRVKSRTLQARLAAEGTSFSRLLDQTRKDFALRQLAVPGTKAGAVATQCGFSDPAAFTRAFRRWTGSTPKAWLDKVEAHASG